MSNNVLLYTITITLNPSPDIMRHRNHGATVKQDLEDFIVVLVGCQDERGDLWGEGRDVAVCLLPRLLAEAVEES